MAEINVTSRYPYSDEFEYSTMIEQINLDEERINDLVTGNGFIVNSPKVIKSDIKDPKGIFSSKYGQTLQDINPFSNRYRCECGATTFRFYRGIECDICHTKVKYVDDNFGFFGWITLEDPYHIIHPNMYKWLSVFIGEPSFKNILGITDKKDQDGNSVLVERSDNEPFAGIGMSEFHDRFDEVLEYYRAHFQKANPKKLEYYHNIVQNRNKVWTQSIPVYTIHLRPFKYDSSTNIFNFEKTNALYNIMSRLAGVINNDKLRIFRKRKPKEQLLADLQAKFIDLYDEIIKIISGKKGTIRSIFGGRFNFIARSVIIPGPSLRIDEIKLSYQALIGLMQQRLINILHKSYSMTYDEAYKFLFIESMRNENPIIRNIIEGIIKDEGRGIPMIINRNPTTTFGGILQVYCVGITGGFTMEVPLQIISGLGADFDGDAMNILYIINKEFLEATEKVFNPRNAMYISNNDGFFNNTYNHLRDTIINLNTAIGISRSKYTKEQLETIQSAQNS